MMNTVIALRARSDSVRPVRTAERAIGSDRNRSISPLCRSSASPTPVVIAPKAHLLHEDSGHQEIDVAAAGHLDRATEDVDEQQHEHDGLDDREDEQLG